jgi:two-component system phosphate regulon sensor histidine kinase PhoR
MKKRSIGLIISLMGFALLGVIAMQYFFLRQSYQLQSKLFDRDVSQALNTVVTKLTRQDVNTFLNKKADDIDLAGKKVTIKIVKKNTKPAAQLPFEDNTASQQAKQLHDRKIAQLRDSLQRLLLRTKVDDELYGLPQEEMVNVRYRVEEYADDLGNIHQRILPPEITNIPHAQIRYLLLLLPRPSIRQAGSSRYQY